ncbi:hypothetical protein DYB31_002929 [Aphanomyces astaci]|uniref:Smr domain-containing protein n=2 Tax=Aphanomyces astaci TaxID=112090 RepID=A0A397FAG7_APHAT|nr:hypothetical protein DYB31_002929 [Aphanomyces astaci]
MDERAMVGMLADMVAYSISEDDIQLVLVECDGDMTKALDELLTLKTTRELDDAESMPDTQLDGQMQWELFTAELASYGLDAHSCHELIQVLKEQRGTGKLLSSAIVQELLDSMDTIDEHPLQDLTSRFPTIPVAIVHEVYEHHEYDVQATAKALIETKALLNASGTFETFSYASIATPSASNNGAPPPPPPPVNCKHAFPTLTKFQLGPANEDTSTVWHKALHGLPTGHRGTLTTRMKLEFLQTSFPSIDSDILCLALLVGNSSVVAAEAMLESSFPSACQARPDQVAVLTQMRHKLQEAREHAAFAFFSEHQASLVAGACVDLHGLYVQEAYQVLEYCVSFCRDRRISKFEVITGVGNHSKASRGGRMYTTFPAALRRRGISFEQHGGKLTVYPCQVQS